MALLDNVLEFENYSEEDKISLLKQCSYNDLSEFKSSCLLLDRPDIVLEVEELCGKIDSLCREEMFNDKVEKKMKLQMQCIDNLLSEIGEDCLDEELIVRLDNYFEQSYSIVLEKLISGFKKRLLQLKKEGKGYSSFSFGFTMMRLDKKPKNNDAFVSYLEEKYKEKLSDFGLDEFGFDNIEIRYNSTYPCRIEEQLQFSLDENDQERHRFDYLMSVSFSAPKYKQYSLKKQTENNGNE